MVGTDGFLVRQVKDDGAYCIQEHEDANDGRVSNDRSGGSGGGGGGSSGNDGNGSGGSGVIRNGKKKAIAVSTGDGGLRVWSIESLLTNDDTHRRSQNNAPPTCSRVLVRPLHEGMFGHSLQQQVPGSTTKTTRTWSVTTQMCEIENMNFFLTGDTHGSVSIWCELSWTKVLCFNTTQSISSLSVLFDHQQILILTNGNSNGGSKKTALLHTIDMQKVV